jgi:hypothetical protein
MTIDSTGTAYGKNGYGEGWQAITSTGGAKGNFGRLERPDDDH